MDKRSRVSSKIEAGGRPSWTARVAGPALGIAIVLGSSLVWAWGTFGSVSHAMAYVAGRRLVIEPMTLRPEADRPGERVRESFRVSNLSGRPLTIVGASSGCACTTVGELPVEIPARDTRELAIEYRYDGDASELAIRYFTDSEVIPTFTVVVAPIASEGTTEP